MTVRTHRIPLSDVLRSLEVRNAVGSTTVDADPAAEEVVVEVQALNSTAEELVDRLDLIVTRGHLRLAAPDRRLLRAPAFALSVTVPPGTDATVTGASATGTLRGRLGAATLTSSSGDLDVEHCTSLQARSASGDVRAGRVDGPAVVGNASGDVRIADAGGPVQLRTASGDLLVGTAATDVTARTASGDVRIDAATSGTVRLTTVSGDATVGVAPGLRIWLDVQTVSGRLRSELAEDAPDAGGAQLSITLQSVSGDLRLRRAAGQPVAPPSAG